MIAHVTCGLAALVGLLWLVGLTASWTWMSSQSSIVSFQANLMTVYTSKGAVSSLASWTGKVLGATTTMNKFDKMMEQSLWYDDAVAEFCGTAMETAFNWCANWQQVMYASWAMLTMGVLTSVLLLMGAGFMYYYSSVHATETGRSACKMCFLVAPNVALLGMLMYSLLTWDFGKGGVTLFKMEARAMYGKGYIIAWLLTLLSYTPLYATTIFLREDPLEKKRGEADEEQQFAGTYGSTYGGSDPSAQGQPYGGAYAGGYGAGQAPQCGASPGYGYPAPTAPPASGGVAW